MKFFSGTDQSILSSTLLPPAFSFVDEGFGSLDEESLEQAMKALNGLTEGNRLVGIISHVQELKAMIEKQIVVTKEKAGEREALKDSPPESVFTLRSEPL